MAFDNDDHKDGVSRRHALERMIWASSGVLWMVSGGGLGSLGQISSAQAATAMAQATLPRGSRARRHEDRLRGWGDKIRTSM
jgi:hypothetical protein